MAFIKRVELPNGDTYDIRDESAIHDLPTATKSVLGGVIIGDGLNVTNGVVSTQVQAVVNSDGGISLIFND